MKSTRYYFVLALLALLCASSAWSQTVEKTVLLNFKHSPFPFEGHDPDKDEPFFNVIENGRRGHNSPRGGVYWEDTTYSDNRVLLSLSPQFNLSRHPIIVVYFHGNQSLLDRDVIERQQLPQQLASAGINALLVAPQLARDALDSSAGHFSENGFFAKFLDETAEQVARWQNNKKYTSVLKKAPVVFVSYSGGYQAATYALERGGVNKRVVGVMMLDSLYDYEAQFADWIHANKKNSFFFSAYTKSTRDNNLLLQSLLKQRHITYKTQLPKSLTSGHIAFLDLGEEVDHDDLLSYAWTDQPLTSLLCRLKPPSQHKKPR